MKLSALLLSLYAPIAYGDPLGPPPLENTPPGYQVDYVHEFIRGLGKWLDKPINLNQGIGKPKPSALRALSLGDGGQIVVAYTWGIHDSSFPSCFDNVEGPDLYVHEPMMNNFYLEEIRVEVGVERNIETTPWVEVGTGAATLENQGFIPFDLGNIPHAYWIRITDNNSRKTSDYLDDAGFELSTVILKELCEVEVSSQ